MNDLLWQLTLSALVFLTTYLLVRYGWHIAARETRRQLRRYDDVLNRQLLLDVPPQSALVLAAGSVVFAGLFAFLIGGGVFWALGGALIGLLLPGLVVRHLQQKRAERLEEQLVDGVTTLSAGARAGLNLVQCFELLHTNAADPMRQEIGQMLREYQMGLDLNQAMRNAANRIESTNYRLVFTALEMHRQRGGNTAESLDRIAESVREIQRLEGKLDALTAQGRFQARMMAAMPVIILVILYGIEPGDTTQLFVDPLGRLLLLAAAALIVVSFLWIRRIMAVDI